jgi:hypothetical protein
LGTLRRIAAITRQPVIRLIVLHLQQGTDPSTLGLARWEPGRVAWLSV